MSEPSNQNEAIQEALAELHWSFSREGRDWGEEEMLAKHALLPKRLEVLQGKLLGTQTERLRMLASLLEHVGLDLAQQLVRAAERKPSGWRECLESDCRDSQDFAESGGGEGASAMATHRQPGASARTWNYRAIRFEHGDDSHVAIHEVHYEGGRPVAYAEGPAPVIWFEEEGPETGFKVLDRFREALERPVLTQADFHRTDPHPLGTLRTSEVSVDALVPLQVAVAHELGVDTTTREAFVTEMESWDDLRAVGRERFWLPAANRYSLKTLIELRKIMWSFGHKAKGTRHAKRARIKEFLRGFETPRGT